MACGPSFNPFFTTKRLRQSASGVISLASPFSQEKCHWRFLSPSVQISAALALTTLSKRRQVEVTAPALGVTGQVLEGASLLPASSKRRCLDKIRPCLVAQLSPSHRTRKATNSSILQDRGGRTCGEFDTSSLSRLLSVTLCFLGSCLQPSCIYFSMAHTSSS
jgi:hypothetical protein